MCNQRILTCRFCQKNLFEYRVSRCNQYVEKCRAVIGANPDLMGTETVCPVRPELWFTSTTCGNVTCQPGFKSYSPSQQYTGLETQYTSTINLREPLNLSGQDPSDCMMSVEDEWRIVRPVQRGKVEVIFCRDETGNSLPSKIESQPQILENAHSDAQEPRFDLAWSYKPYLPWLGAIAPDRDSGLSCPPAKDYLPYASGRVRSHTLQEGKPGKLEESWNLLTRITNWVFSDYGPPMKKGGLTTKPSAAYEDNTSTQAKMAGTFPPDVTEFPSLEYDLFYPSPKFSSRYEHAPISNTGSPLFTDLEAATQGLSFFDYSSDEELDASFHTARGESSDLTHEPISLERVSDQETLFGDNEAKKLEAKPLSTMERELECRVYDFSVKPLKLPERRDSLLGGDRDEPRRPSPNEPRINRPCSRSILERYWELNFNLGRTSLFYDLVDEQGPTENIGGGSTSKIGNSKGGHEK